jgi:hypothetical protein
MTERIARRRGAAASHTTKRRERKRNAIESLAFPPFRRARVSAGFAGRRAMRSIVCALRGFCVCRRGLDRSVTALRALRALRSPRVGAIAA